MSLSPRNVAITPTPRKSLINLFSGLLGKGIAGELDTPSAVMVPIVAAMLADGRVEEAELEQIEALCRASPIFERNSPAENDFLISRAMRAIEDHGLKAACEHARAYLSPALRETAFVHGVRVIFSDGYVGRLEKEVLEQMIEWLEIDESRARMMIEVVSIMQHPETA